ncbi:HNH endonuclease [Geodermatophilus tzadiensis]|uniref:HNH endonuclease n=1 Tax=Geodermatophilus tzadiensis TaxID=1137988 RepID=UPI000D048438|nr:hypothetical protein [Geodermatophilus tzadiensis]
MGDVAALVAGRNRIDAALARRVRAAEHRQAAEDDGLKSWWAEVHHLVHWLDGGETDLANLALCQSLPMPTGERPMSPEPAALRSAG